MPFKGGKVLHKGWLVEEDVSYYFVYHGPPLAEDEEEREDCGRVKQWRIALTW